MATIVGIIARETSTPKNGVGLVEFYDKQCASVDDQWYRRGCETEPTILMSAPVYHNEIMVLARESSVPKNGANIVTIGEVVHNNAEIMILGADEDILSGNTHRKSDGEGNATSDQKMRGGIAG